MHWPAGFESTADRPQKEPGNLSAPLAEFRCDGGVFLTPRWICSAPARSLVRQQRKKAANPDCGESPDACERREPPRNVFFEILSVLPFRFVDRLHVSRPLTKVNLLLFRDPEIL
jgi:hypothetical protein